MSDPARRGRNIIIAIMTGYILLEILVIVLGAAARDLRLGRTLVRLTLEIGLFYYLYAGRSWARWIAGSLSLLAGLFGLSYGLFFYRINLAGILVLSCFGALFLAAAALLFFSPDVREYLGHRRSGPSS
jgi:hypothetical protein